MFGIFKKKKKKPDTDFIPIIEKLINLQLVSRQITVKQLFGTLMTNKQAAGYIFGFHDSLLQCIGMYDADNPGNAAVLIEKSYKHIFGNQAGYTLFNASLISQEQPDFKKGVLHGGEDMYEYFNNQTPATGLSLILLWQRDA